MPITDINTRPRHLGRLRAGEYDADASRPTSGDTWRLTSPHRNLLDAASALWGGTVEALDRADTDDQYQLTTSATELEVILPPQDISDTQWYELYTAAGLRRRCDGVVMVAGGDLDRASNQGTTFPPACICNPEHRDCKPTTHLLVVLPQLPDIGTWRLTTKSIYAAAEIPAQLELLFRRTPYPAAVLALEQRSNKRKGPDRHVFTVPILRTNATLESMLAGDSSIAVAGVAGGEGPQPGAPSLPPPNDDDVAVPTVTPPPPLEVPATHTPEPPPPPANRNLDALRAHLEDVHIYTLTSKDDLIAWICETWDLGFAAGVSAWRGETLDSIAQRRLKAFYEVGTLDVAGDDFATRARHADLTDLRTFATRLLLEANTHADRSR